MKILPCYPGFTRRCITFTIDDGNIAMDRKFLEIVRPHGIRGTFNLCPHSMDREDGFYRDFYNGYGIANHVECHPFAMDDSINYVICNEPVGDQPADPAKIYPSHRGDGFYMKHYNYGWRELADTPTYIACIKNGQKRLERVFGAGTVRGFVWPYAEQNNAQIKAAIRSLGFTSVRKTGDTRDTTGFALPADRMAWSYNAHNRTLLEIIPLYEAYPDDGTLKFFAMGVHSYDFERDNNWADLVTFAEKYGDRPNDFWYATVDEIFDYSDAMDRLTVTDTAIENPTDLTLYVELDGEGLTLPPYTTHSI